MVDWKARVKRTEPESLVFSTWSGKPISPNNVSRRWIYPVCETLGLKRVNWLTLRRTYSSWAHEKGVPGKVIAQLMGHAKVDTTLNVYTQVLDAHCAEPPKQSDPNCSQLFTNRNRRASQFIEKVAPQAGLVPSRERSERRRLKTAWGADD